ncbi:MAG TPA: carbamoyltransferase C-terminal domain-containing protein, partial [Rhodothermales bacterium]|nr:carbamoyltransferase C-terminal domain-containing protein [Rhodothermales bacterium]
RDDGLAFERRTRQRINDLNDRLTADLLGKRFDWVSAGLQAFTEALLTSWIDQVVAASGVPRVLAAGGVFMNVKANKCIAELASVESFEAFPSCGDESLPLGAYYLAAAERFGEVAVPSLAHYYLGDDLDERETLVALRRSGFTYDRPHQIDEAVADVLVAGHPIARCAGRMEFGARALGNRSILGDPKNEDLVRVINMMVKKRDFWMPFAPIVKANRQEDYLHNPKQLRSPYMMMTFDTREDAFRDLIAAVHNADLTCRAQLLTEAQNPDMYAILEAFEARTGRAVLLNTSFNLHGYPIVRTAEEALAVLRDSGLEYLQVGPYLVSK